MEVALTPAAAFHVGSQLPAREVLALSAEKQYAEVQIAGIHCCALSHFLVITPYEDVLVSLPQANRLSTSCK